MNVVGICVFGMVKIKGVSPKYQTKSGRKKEYVGEK